MESAVISRSFSLALGLGLLASPAAAQAAPPVVHVSPLTGVAAFSSGHTLLDFDQLPVGTSVAAYATSSGVAIQQVGGSAPLVWKDSTLPAAGPGFSLTAGPMPANKAVHVVQPFEGLWPMPMPLLGHGLPAELPSEPALRLQFTGPQSRVALDVRSVAPARSTLVITAVAAGVPLGTVYLDAAKSFGVVGLESSSSFDELRVDLVNPETGELSLDNLRFELDDQDADLDGVSDFADVCPDEFDPDQADADADGTGDACDPWPLDPGNDADEDGLPAPGDNCPSVHNLGQEDADGDGIGDACDPFPLLLDSDGDGIDDESDNCVAIYNPTQTDCDGDGVGDVCDPSLLSPASVSLSLARGQSATVAESICLAPAPPIVDILIAIDVTGSMSGEIANLKTVIVDFMLSIGQALPSDLNLGLVSFRDYSDSFTSCGYSGSYGSGSDYAFKVEHPMTGPASIPDLINAVNGLGATGGSDGPESYARVFWEIGQPDSGIGFRNGSARFVLLFADERPHDCDLSESIPCNLPSSGVDPGRDETLFTADDVDWQDQALPELLAEYIRPLTIFSSTDPLVWCGWQEWSRSLFGNSMQINTNGTIKPHQSVVEKLSRLIGESTHFPDQGLTFQQSPSQLLIAFTPPFIPGPLALPSTPMPFETTVTVPSNLPGGITSLSANVAVRAGGTVIGYQTIDVTVLP